MAQIQRQKNTGSVLVEKANAFAPYSIDLIKENIIHIRELVYQSKDGKLVDNKFGEIYFEIILFYIHFINRIALNYLSIEQADIFVSALFIKVREILSSSYETKLDANKFNYSMSNLFEEKVEEYEKYQKLFAEKGEDLKETLFWEFGKKVTLTILKLEKNTTMITIISFLNNSLYESIYDLKLIELLED